MFRTLLALTLISCAPDSAEKARSSSTSTGAIGATLPSTGTVDTGDSGTEPPAPSYDCAQPWPEALEPAIVGSVPASEDFDIDADGNLIHIESRNLVARSSIDNTVTVIVPNLTWSAAGTRVLRNGDIVVADTFEGSLVLVDRLTGGTSNLLAGTWPNGIDVDADDNVYVSDFTKNGSVVRINAYDPNDREVILSGVDRPNGVVLSPDGRTLYVAFNWASEIWAIERDASGAWGAPVLFKEGSGAAQSVTTDICGSVYWESFDTVRRQSADGSDSGDVMTTPGFQYMPNLRWGYGKGRFAAGHLYALSRGELWEFPIGIPGKLHISDQ